jgi:hypothetical protein
MLTPQVRPVRRLPAVAMVILIAAITGATAAAVTAWFLHTTGAKAPCCAPRAPGMIAAHRSPHAGERDEMSPGAFAPDGAADDMFLLEVDADQPIAHIFVVYEPEGLQWDTVIRDEQIPYGRNFAGHKGAETWHLGVKENGQWVNAPDGQLRGLGAGHHELELLATSPQGFGQRLITVLFADGTQRSVAVPAMAGRSYRSQGGN